MAVGGVVAMALDRVWWLGFLSGFLIFSGICLVAIFQVRHLLASFVPESSIDGTTPKLGRWRIVLMVTLLGLKTFGVGASVYWILLVWRLPLPAVAAGLFVGLGALVFASVLGVRFGAKKKKKNH